MCSDSALSMSQLHNGSQAAKVTPVAGLVDCLVKIGGISEAQAALHQHLPNQVLNLCLVCHYLKQTLLLNYHVFGRFLLMVCQDETKR